MRVKISVPSAPGPLKAWFIVDEAQVPTVAHLKERLCADLAPLKDARTLPGDVTLLLDDFQLLDASHVGVLRDGDLVCVSVRPVALRKSKREHESDDSIAPRKKAKRTASPQRPAVHANGKDTKAQHTSISKLPTLPSSKSSSGSSTSTSSSSSSTSDSDSDSSSDSDSDSDSTSSSSSSDTPESHPIGKLARSSAGGESTVGARLQSALSPSKLKPVAKPLVVLAQPVAPAPAPQAPLVPPGQGKPQTHKRNVRRRRKQQFEHATISTAADTPAGASIANATPLGVRAAGTDVKTEYQDQGQGDDYEEGGEVMMASLSNKNKRRGFKNAMSDPVKRKIVFAAATATIMAPTPALMGMAALLGAGVHDTSQPSTADHMAPLVAASASQAQDQDGDWSQSWKRPRLVPPSERQERGELPPNMFVTSVDVEEGMKRKRKKRPRDPEPEAVLVYDEEVQEEQGAEAMLNEPTAGAMIVDEQAGHSTGMNWAAVDARWGSMPPVVERANVSPGQLVGWKTLAINPRTFTPEILLNAARVVKVDDDGAVAMPLLRPEAAKVSFGGGGEGDAHVELEEECVTWDDVFSLPWKIIDT